MLWPLTVTTHVATFCAEAEESDVFETVLVSAALLTEKPTALVDELREVSVAKTRAT